MRSSSSNEKYLRALSAQCRTDIDERAYNVVIKRLILCNRCGNAYTQNPNNVINGHGCKHCATNSSVVSESMFRQKLALTLREDIDTLPYLAHDKRRIKCLVCGHIQSQIPSSVISGRSCSECALENIGKLASVRYAKLDLTGKVFGQLVVLGPDHTTKRRFWKCKCHCGNETSMSTGDLNRGNRSCGCLRSGPEIDILNYVKSLGFDEARSDRKILGNRQELDIYVESKKIALEYCGLHWHGAKTNGKFARSKHLKKLEACTSAGIRLITIFADEWLTRNEIVKDRIAHLLGVGHKSVGARKCEVVHVSSEEAGIFADLYHLQGHTRGTVSLGLRLGVDLVAVGTFLKSSDRRKGLSTPGVWELVRYTIKTGLSVQGGLGRILSHFVKVTPLCSEVVSFADRRWSTGGLYRACGFVLTRTTPPDYRYFKGEGPRLHKFGFRKQILSKKYGFNMSMTETEMTQKAGFDRIWDCGLERWVWYPPEKPQNLFSKPLPHVI